MIHPLSSAPEPKSRFVPSKWEHKKIMKIVRAIRKGWIKPAGEPKDEDKSLKFWDLWSEQTDKQISAMHIPAPKVALPRKYSACHRHFWQCM